MAANLNPVTLARGYAGVTQTELARRIGRSQPFVSGLEKGERDFVPLASVLAQQTGLPLAFFDPSIEWSAPEGHISFRKRSACPASVRDKARFYAAIAHTRLAPLIAQFVRYPRVDLLNIPMENVGNTQDARTLGASTARRLREEWGIGWGPITNVLSLLESRGIRVFFVREAVEHLDGFACWIAETPYVFLNQETQDPARVRLDAAHEVAHLVLHRELALDARSDLFEAMAFGFANEFLAPWETFKREAPSVVDLDALGKLRGRWRMSMQAMVKHMHDNGAISDSAYSHAFKKFAFLGYRRAPEPIWIMPDTSAIHTKFIDVAESKGFSIANIAEECGVPEKLLGEMIPATSLALFD